MTPTPRVLFVTPWYPSPEAPIAGVFIRDIVESVARTADVRVVHLAGFGSNAQNRRVNSTPTVLRMTSRAAVPGFRDLSLTLSLFRAVLQFRDCGWSPDLIHAHTHEAAVAAAALGLLMRVPVVVTEHSSGLLRSRHESMGPLHDRLVRWTFRRTTVIAVSNALATAIESRYSGCRPMVIPNTVNEQVFNPASEARLGRRYPVLATTSLLDPNKRVDDLIRVVHTLHHDGLPARLKIIGDGPEAPRLRDLVAELRLGGSVEFCGSLDRLGVAGELRKCDLFLVGSKHETFCVAAAEALSTGLPVITTACGGPEDYVDSRNGRVVPVQDVTAMATAVREIWKAMPSKIQVSRDAHRRFGGSAVGRRTLDCYRRALQAGPPRLFARA